MKPRPATISDAEPVGNYLRLTILAFKPELADRLSACSNDELTMALSVYLKETTYTAEDLIRLSEAKRKKDME